MENWEIFDFTFPWRCKSRVWMLNWFLWKKCQTESVKLSRRSSQQVVDSFTSAHFPVFTGTNFLEKKQCKLWLGNASDVASFVNSSVQCKRVDRTALQNSQIHNLHPFLNHLISRNFVAGGSPFFTCFWNGWHDFKQMFLGINCNFHKCCFFLHFWNEQYFFTTLHISHFIVWMSFFVAPGLFGYNTFRTLRKDTFYTHLLLSISSAPKSLAE